MASSNGSLALFKLFVEKMNIDINLSNRCQLSYFIQCHRESEETINIAKYMLLKGYPAHIALSTAVEYRLIDLVKLLLDYGADPNHKNHAGVTPLMWAFGQPSAGASWFPSFKGSFELAELLLERGGDPTIRSNQKRTPRSILKSQGWGDASERKFIELLERYGG